MTFFTICHLRTFSTSLHLELAPGHMSTAWELIKAVLTCLLKHLLSAYFFFLQTNEWKHFSCVLATQEPGIRELKDFLTSRDPPRNICFPLLQKYRHCPVHGAKLHLAAISVKATQQNTTAEGLQGKIYLLRSTYYLLILRFFPFLFSPPKIYSCISCLYAFMIQCFVITAIRYQMENSKPM